MSTLLIPRPLGAPADWPEFPEPRPVSAHSPLLPQACPPLALSWLQVTPAVLDPGSSDLIHAWLTLRGAAGPVAVAYRHRFNRVLPWGWRCGVYVIGAPLHRQPGKTMDHSCRRSGVTRSVEEAHAEAAAHITHRHPDAAVPYHPRLLSAWQFYARRLRPST
ncbi:hypothetical protein AB0N09_28165 [Streptomyces erythrochromogenes]|uniref:hypothetical protein n=1 Tax=Streptomyces erythrochromogenes TaxID=285574 RepID=UPI00341DDDB1